MKQVSSYDNIVIKQVMVEDEEPVTVEYYSHNDSRNHILSAETFQDNFGYSEQELVHWIVAHKSAFIEEEGKVNEKL